MPTASCFILSGTTLCPPLLSRTRLSNALKSECVNEMQEVKPMGSI